VTVQRYQWLLFDADGTLFDFDRSQAIALAEVFSLSGVPFEPGYLATYQRISRTLWEALERGEITPALLKVRRFELLLETIGVNHPPAAFSDRYLECLATRAELLPDAVEVLSVLSGKYRMAILTNGLQAVQRPRLARSAIRDYMAGIIVSEEIGASKPAPRYFDAAFAQLKIPAKHQALMIGDSWASDIMGAMNYGLDTCWYNPGKKPRPADGNITREITGLRELVTWLG
jgi:YjjG family noncanonical pyrimidine nucleotidase